MFTPIPNFSGPNSGADLRDYLNTTVTLVNAQFARLQDVINVVALGAGAGGSDTAAFNAASEMAQVTGQMIWIPAGNYNFPAADGNIDTGTGYTNWVGAGREATFLYFEEGDVSGESGHFLFRNNSVNINNTGPVSFSNFTVVGTLSDFNTSGGGSAIRAQYYPSVTIRNCRFENLRSGGTEVLFCTTFLADGNQYVDVAHDGCRSRDTANTIIVNNYLHRIGDDSISCHTSSVDPPVKPISEGIIIQNNRIVIGKPIKCLGGRKVNISNNSLHLMNLWAIYVGNITGTDEGDNASFQWTIEGNQITDTVYVQSDGTPTSGNPIAVDFDAARGAVATGNVAPMLYDGGEGTFIHPWDWYSSNNDNVANAVAPGKQVVIRGNIIGRTLPAVANFSDWGFGEALFGAVSYDPAMTDAVMRPSAAIVFATAPPTHVDISGNQIEHVTTGIQVVAPTTDHQIKGWSIKNNTFFDVATYGTLFGTAAKFADVVIEGNRFNGDYYRANTNSNIDGTYDASSTPTALAFGALIGAVIRNNTFANWCNIVTATDLTKHTIEGNIVFCGTPTAVDAFNAANKGVGVPLTGYRQWKYHIIDADPTSGTFNAFTSTFLHNAASIPTTGWYYQGWMVWNTAPTFAGKVLGWLRLTTGTAHVSGTDWLVVTSA